MSRRGEAAVVRMCGKDQVDAGPWCERHRADPNTPRRQAQWNAVLRPDWDTRISRLDELANRERERAERQASHVEP